MEAVIRENPDATARPLRISRKIMWALDSQGELLSVIPILGC